MGKLGKIFLTDLMSGLMLTLSYAFKKPVTYQYPEVKRPIEPRYRGRHRLLLNEDGAVRCVACGLCAAVCPSKCIYIEPAESEEGQRYPAVYEVQVGRCIYCGFCQEVCPFDAVVLTEEHELATIDKNTLLYNKETLLPEPENK